MNVRRWPGMEELVTSERWAGPVVSQMDLLPEGLPVCGDLGAHMLIAL